MGLAFLYLSRVSLALDGTLPSKEFKIVSYIENMRTYLQPIHHPPLQMIPTHHLPHHQQLQLSLHDFY